jgi:hypothetical protein
MDIGSDDEDTPEGPVTSLASTGIEAQALPAQATSSAPKQYSGIQQGETPDVVEAKVGATAEKPAPEPSWVVEKRKTQSQGSAEEVKLPASKRSRGKSKSHPSVIGTSGDQLAMPQETEQEILPRSSNNVPLRYVFN